MSPAEEQQWLLSRRALLGRSAHGVGGMALATMLESGLNAQDQSSKQDQGVQDQHLNQ